MQTPDEKWRNSEKQSDEEDLEKARFSFIQLSLRMVYFTSYISMSCSNKKEKLSVHSEVISRIYVDSKSSFAENY